VRDTNPVPSACPSGTSYTGTTLTPTSGPDPPNADGDWIIGGWGQSWKRGDTEYELDGDIDYVRITDLALSPGEFTLQDIDPTVVDADVIAWAGDLPGDWHSVGNWLAVNPLESRESRSFPGTTLATHVGSRRNASVWRTKRRASLLCELSAGTLSLCLSFLAVFGSMPDILAAEPPLVLTERPVTGPQPSLFRNVGIEPFEAKIVTQCHGDKILAAELADNASNPEIDVANHIVRQNHQVGRVQVCMKHPADDSHRRTTSVKRARP